MTSTAHTSLPDDHLSRERAEPRRRARTRPPSQPSPLHVQKRPRRKATSKPEKNAQTTERQRVIFSVGADLVRATVSQAHQGTMFAHWCAQDFDTNEHSYSQAALVKTSDKYAATYRMPRAGRSTIASRSQELEFVNVERREEVGISDKDGRLRHMVQSNRYMLDIGVMIKTLHAADPDHVLPLWDKIVRSMEEDQDHSIWTHNWRNNWTHSWCYSSPSSMSSASPKSATRKSSSPRRGEPDDDSRRDLSGERASQSRSARGAGSSTPSPSAARPRAERDTQDEKYGLAEEVITRINEYGFIQLSVSKGRSPIARVLSRFSADDLVNAVIWRLDYDGYRGKVRFTENVRNFTAVFVSQLEDIVVEWLTFGEAHDVQTYQEFLDLAAAEYAAATAAGDRIFKLLNQAISTDSEEEALAFFAKAVDLYAADEHELVSDVEVVFSDRVRMHAQSAVKTGDEKLFKGARRTHQGELKEHAKKLAKQEERELSARLSAHKAEHPDHYDVPCKRCRRCNELGQPEKCPDKLHRLDCSPECAEASYYDSWARDRAHNLLFPEHYVDCGQCGACTSERRYSCDHPVHVATGCPVLPAEEAPIQPDDINEITGEEQVLASAN